MAGGLERRTPRGLREAQAFRAVQVGSVAATGFVATLVLAIAGVIGDTLPVLFVIVTILAVLRFASVTGLRNRRR